MKLQLLMTIVLILFRRHYDGSHLSSGVYIYRLHAGPHIESLQMLLAK